MTEIVVSKFGGTSVADFTAMNRSADIVLSDANVRLVVLSASAGITNLLVALAEGMEPGERFATLDASVKSSSISLSVCVIQMSFAKRLNACWKISLFWRRRHRWRHRRP